MQQSKRIGKLLCVLALLFPSIILATTVPLAHYYQDHWTSRDGLPHNSINDIAQTTEGYLWFATWEGVARYNGRQFHTFMRNDESGYLIRVFVD